MQRFGLQIDTESRMDEKNSYTEPEQNDGKNNEEAPGQNPVSLRSYLLMILAGGYLAYTGYRLCENVLSGSEGGSMGFFAAGAAFIVIGAGMLIWGGYKAYQAESQHRKRVETEETEAVKTMNEEPKEEKKPMSIAERARLADALKDKEEQEEE